MDLGTNLEKGIIIRDELHPMILYFEVIYTFFKLPIQKKVITFSYHNL